MRKKLSIFFFLFTITFATGCSFNQVQTNLNSENNSELPKTELISLDNKPIKLSNYQNQKNLVLIFSATWCHACVQELIDVQKYYNYADKNKLEIIWIDNNEEENVVKDFRNQHQLTFSIAFDHQNKFYHQYEVTTLPTTVFLDQQGKTQAIKVGALTETELANQVGKLF